MSACDGMQGISLKLRVTHGASQKVEVALHPVAVALHGGLHGRAAAPNLPGATSTPAIPCDAKANSPERCAAQEDGKHDSSASKASLQCGLRNLQDPGMQQVTASARRAADVPPHPAPQATQVRKRSSIVALYLHCRACVCELCAQYGHALASGLTGVLSVDRHTCRCQWVCVID